MRRPFLLTLLAVAAAPVANPHDPSLEAASQEALSRSRILSVSGRVSDIRGLTSATSGRVAAIRSFADDLRAAGLLVTATDAGLRVTIPEAILFDFDRATLRPSAEEKLQALAAGAARVAELPVAIEGHTDAKGGLDYNQQLSRARAEAVRRWLAGHGVASGRLTARGFAYVRPVAPNTTSSGADNPSGRRKNRRVEVVIGSA